MAKHYHDLCVISYEQDSTGALPMDLPVPIGASTVDRLMPELSSLFASLFEEAMWTKRVRLPEALCHYLLDCFEGHIRNRKLIAFRAFDTLMKSMRCRSARATQALYFRAGEESLIFAGFFYDLALKRSGSLPFYINYGRSFYHEAQVVVPDTEKRKGYTSAQLAKEFISMAKVLQGVRQRADLRRGILPLDIEQLKAVV